MSVIWAASLPGGGASHCTHAPVPLHTAAGIAGAATPRPSARTHAPSAVLCRHTQLSTRCGEGGPGEGARPSVGSCLSSTGCFPFRQAWRGTCVPAPGPRDSVVRVLGVPACLERPDGVAGSGVCFGCWPSGGDDESLGV